MLQQEDEFDFDAGVQRKGVDADGGADVLASVAEEFQEKFTGPVGDLRLLGEIAVGADKRADAEAAGEFVDGAFDGFDGAKGVDHALAGGEFGLFDRAARGDLADGQELAIFHGELTGDVEEIAGAFHGNISAKRSRDSG